MVTGLEKQAVLAVDNDVRESTCSRRDNNPPCKHRLEADDWSAFGSTVGEHARRNHYHIRGRKQLFAPARSYATDESRSH